MPSNIELALVTRVIETGDFHTLDKAQIDKSFFSTPECIELYEYLKDVFHNPISRGQLPTMEMVRYRFPTFYPFTSGDTVPVLAEQLRREKIRTDIMLLSQEMQELADRNPMEALATLRAKSASISSIAEAGEDMSIASGYDTLLQQYEKVQDSKGLLGIPYPMWGGLNEATQGMQDGQFIVLFGRPKSMKSWIAVYIAVWCYIHQRKRVLFYTREMPPLQVLRRVAASVARVDYNAFINGKLQPELKQKTFEILQTLMGDEIAAGTNGLHQPFLKVISDKGARGSGGGGGVGWLQSKVRELKPDILFVDGMYLMKDDRSNSRTVDWKNIAHISQDMKITAQDFNIPVVGITQANRASDKSTGDDLTELAYADALGQDADAVFRVSRKVVVDEQTKHSRCEVTLRAPGLREGVFEGVVLEAIPGIDFRYLRTITEKAEDANGYGEKPKLRRSWIDPRIPPSR